MILSKEEKTALISNVVAILEFVRNEIQPYLNEYKIVEFKDLPHNRPIMMVVNPSKGINSIEFTRGVASSQYWLNDTYDSHSIKADRRSRYCFFESYREMIALIENWKIIKDQLLNYAQHDKNLINVLNNFEV